MIYISHRGNINGKFESYENEPNYIDAAISNGYDVEVDIWLIDGIWYLGHDTHQYGIPLKWVLDRSHKLWVHCKNINAVEYFIENKNTLSNINWFWHEKDVLTLTSHRYIWAYSGKQPIKNSIAVMPEIYNDDVSKCIGICSDNISSYK